MNPLDNIGDPILRAAVKEPVAFWGGVFAGVLRLNLTEDPLKSWVERTASQAGLPGRPGAKPAAASQSLSSISTYSSVSSYDE